MARSRAMQASLVTHLTFSAAALLTAQLPLAAQATLYASPQGRPDARGDAAAPLDLSSALKLASPEGSEVVLLDGIYRITRPIVLDRRYCGSAARPIRIRAAHPGRAIVRGSLAIPTSGFEKPTATERRRLAASARDHIRVLTLTDEALIAKLTRDLVTGIAINGEFYLPSRFPNSGYAHLSARAVAPEASPPAVPVGKEAYGVRAGHPPFQEKGRARGWLGSLTEPRGARAQLRTRVKEMAGTWQQWQAELDRDNRRNVLTGFLDANWLQRSQPLVAADAASRSIHLSQALSYGWAWKRRDKPFFIFGLLCELDAPGEWAFDPLSRRLFLYPPTELSAAEIEVPVATGGFHLRGAHHVEIRGIDIEYVGGGDVFQLAGQNNWIVDCRVRRCTASGARITGRNERVSGCDFVDCNRHIALGGGRRTPKALVPGKNVVENCHCYQRRFTHRRVTIGISGVGNTLRTCLIHNSLGQAVTVRGNDHLIERNELCNIGYEEGDGGAIYAGGDLAGYGVVYRHNFFHHLMHVPGKVERSGIHLDDLQAGSTCIGNVFFKSAGKGIFMNGGAGHVIEDNVFLAGYRGIYNVGHTAQKTFDLQKAITDGAQRGRRHTKEDYVGRVERVTGKRGWAKQPWRDRYPLFCSVMEDSGQFGRLWPIRCRVRNNWFHDNDKGDRTIWSRVAPAARAKSVIEGDRAISPDAFANYDLLDLRLNPRSVGLPRIPFDAIGLRVGSDRRSMPDKTHLRRKLREFFRGIRCMPGTTKRIDTGAIVEGGPVTRR